MLSLEALRKDVPASIVVFFVALPLCLGVALASGAPLFSGLIAGVMGGVVVGALSGSRLGVSGPAAGLTVIVFSAIETLGSFELFLLAVVLAGIIQVALGILRAGVLGHFFPSSVIHGMLTGIGLIIILKQLPYAFGISAGEVSGLGELFGAIHPGVVVISVFALSVLVLWDTPTFKQNRVLGLLPGPVVAVLGAVGLHLLFAGSSSLGLQSSQLVSVPVASSADEFLSFFTFPDFSQLGSAVVWTTALTIAVVASLETLLSVEAIDKMDPLKRSTPTNRELVAQGVGNTCSGLVGGLPVTQVIVRSTVNLQSGAHSKLSAILHGGLLLVCVATLPQWLNMIPLGVLAAVLIVTGYKLAKPALFQKMWANGPEQFVPFLVTVVGVVATDLLLGVTLGVATALIWLLQRSYNNSHFLHKREQSAEYAEGDRLEITLRLAEEVTFLNKGAIKHELDRVPDNARVVIDKSNCIFVNHDVGEIIGDFIDTAHTRGICVSVIEGSARPELHNGFGLKAVA